MGMSARERAFNNRVVNPVMIALITHGLGPPTYAVVETTGRKTGRRRLVPVASGLDGDTFWMISGRAEKASYVHNIRANPRVRVIARPARLRDGLRTRSRTGTAYLMPGDDAHARRGSRQFPQCRAFTGLVNLGIELKHWSDEEPVSLSTVIVFLQKSSAMPSGFTTDSA